MSLLAKFWTSEELPMNFRGTSKELQENFRRTETCCVHLLGDRSCLAVGILYVGGGTDLPHPWRETGRGEYHPTPPPLSAPVPTWDIFAPLRASVGHICPADFLKKI